MMSCLQIMCIIETFWGVDQGGPILDARIDGAKRHIVIVSQQGQLVPVTLRQVQAPGMLYASAPFLDPLMQCFDTVGWAAGRASGL